MLTRCTPSVCEHGRWTHYGYIMRGSATKGANGKMTVMAYKEGEYTIRIPRFSDDKEVNANYRVGNKKNKNVDRIRMSAPVLAARGDESSQCTTMGKNTVVQKKNQACLNFPSLLLSNDLNSQFTANQPQRNFCH